MSMNIDKEDCAAAGLSVGGVLRDGKLLEISSGQNPFGCFLSSHNDNGIAYNDYADGVNNGDYSSLCHKLMNVALNKPTEQSSDYEIDAVSFKAVDGNRDGNVKHGSSANKISLPGTNYLQLAEVEVYANSNKMKDKKEKVMLTSKGKYPECSAENWSELGDGFCDSKYNIAECGFDDGDCL